MSSTRYWQRTAMEAIENVNVSAVIDRACRTKVPLSRRVAMRLAAQRRGEGEVVSAYRCPFASQTEPKHWHFGHSPSLESLRALAYAIRHREEDLRAS